jgi:hypothetical protein
MAVTGPDEKMDVELLAHTGWFGARAEGEFGTLEGWVQLENGSVGPAGYGADVESGEAKICGTARDGEKLQGS